MLIKQAMQTNKGKKSETVTQANSSTNSTKNSWSESYTKENRTAEKKRKHFYNSILNLYCALELNYTKFYKIICFSLL